MERETMSLESLREVWPVLAPDERGEAFALLPHAEATEFFLELSPRSWALILEDAPEKERRHWLRLLAPDDIADLLQEVEPEKRSALLGLLSDWTRRDVKALLAYEEDEAGGLMNPRFATLHADMTVDGAIRYLRRQSTGRSETIYYAYVVDEERRLKGVVSFRDLMTATADKPVSEVMKTDVLTVPEDMDQEDVAHLVATSDLLAVPVVDGEGRIKGIVTVDDVVDVVQEEATEDIQKIGGTAALDAPYMQTPFLEMIKKRAGWLMILFLGEMLTTSAMGHFQTDIANAVVLALFIPLIISSGGNSGSQASTLVIRAMALNQVRLRDWWRVARREVLSGLALGGILAVMGILRVVLGESFFGSFGEHAGRLALTVGLSLIGVVTWGTLCGSTLPFFLARLRFDPASASAPFVATLVDVCGLLIYFSIAKTILAGAIL